MTLRFLQICPKPPYPPLDGGCIAANNITEGLLNAGHSVKVLALSSQKFPADAARGNAEYKADTGFESVFVDTSFHLGAALSNLFSRRSYNVDRFYSQVFEQKVVSTLKYSRFDAVVFESIYTAPYLAAVRRQCAPGTLALLRAHNIEHEIWEGNRDLETNLAKRVYFSFLAGRLKAYETSMLNRFDGILPITDADKNKLRNLGCRLPMETIPFGVDIKKVTSKRTPSFPSVFHLGAMNWLPNQDAMRWFLNDVWKEIVAKFPNVTLTLAGRAMPDWLRNHRQPGVEVVGEVDNAYDFMASKSIMVVPLFSGSGMRIKIIEGMALGKTIISTSLGAEGVDYQNGKNILIADTKQQFIDQISAVLSDRERCERIGKEAAILAGSRFDNNAIVLRIVHFSERIRRDTNQSS